MLRFNKPERETHTVHVEWNDDEMMDIEIQMPEGLDEDEQSLYMDGAAAGVVGFLSQWEYVEVENDDDEDGNV